MELLMEEIDLKIMCESGYKVLEMREWCEICVNHLERTWNRVIQGRNRYKIHVSIRIHILEMMVAKCV